MTARNYSKPKIQSIPLSSIDANPDQPRKAFEPEALRELAASIDKNGLLQPIVVRPHGKSRFQIIAGERRWRAHQLLKASTISCIVRQVDETTRDIEAIIENLQRQDVTPLEEADAFARLVRSGWTPEEIADRIGAAVFRVRWRLQLVNLQPAIRKLLETGNLDRQQGLELARLQNHADQMTMLRMIQRGQLQGWKAVRNAVDSMLGISDQSDIFGSDAPPVSKQELATVDNMERKIFDLARLANAGWKNGECVIANRVNPDRARLMADRLQAIAASLRIMERELRNVNAQAVLCA